MLCQSSTLKNLTEWILKVPKVFQKSCKAITRSCTLMAYFKATLSHFWLKPRLSSYRSAKECERARCVHLWLPLGQVGSPVLQDPSQPLPSVHQTVRLQPLPQEAHPQERLLGENVVRSCQGGAAKIHSWFRNQTNIWRGGRLCYSPGHISPERCSLRAISRLGLTLLEPREEQGSWLCRSVFSKFKLIYLSSLTMFLITTRGMVAVLPGRANDPKEPQVARMTALPADGAMNSHQRPKTREERRWATWTWLQGNPNFSQQSPGEQTPMWRGMRMKTRRMKRKDGTRRSIRS